MEPTQRIPAGRLALGILLVVFGVSTFLSSIDVVDTRNLWRFWPLFLIVLGIVSEFDAIRLRRGDRSWLLIAIGTWFLVGNFHMWGLSHGRALPIAVVIAGAFIALHAVIDRSPVGKELNS
jgi:hypothetical protein